MYYFFREEQINESTRHEDFFTYGVLGYRIKDFRRVKDGENIEGIYPRINVYDTNTPLNSKVLYAYILE